MNFSIFDDDTDFCVLQIDNSANTGGFLRDAKKIFYILTRKIFDGLDFSNNLSPEFSIEAILYAQRSDENAVPTIVQSVSRSLGRRFGLSLVGEILMSGYYICCNRY